MRVKAMAHFGAMPGYTGQVLPPASNHDLMDHHEPLTMLPDFPSGGGSPPAARRAGAPAPLRLAQIRQRLRAAGARTCHEEAVLRAWTTAQPLASGSRAPEVFHPRSLRDVLPAVAEELAALARLHSDHAGADGSARLLVALADGRTVESVLLPPHGLCVSTQVGCAVGCVFCMTGRDGLQRHLGSAEIVAQVVLARSRHPVRKVVFMGMGEPAHNLDNVLDAIDLLGTLGAIGHKNLVFSTVGDRRVFERLPQGVVKPALALSLHSTFAHRRAELLPRAARIDPAELVELGERYARATHYPIQYQWTLLEGINDGHDELERIVVLLAGKYAVMNLIPYNPVAGFAFRRPARERAEAMARHLCQHGVLAKLRQSAGQDIDAGCGQLRARLIATASPGFRVETVAAPGGEPEIHAPLAGKSA
jgi:23S rRNA (adenine2503-C2)-methyltransferase